MVCSRRLFLTLGIGISGWILGASYAHSAGLEDLDPASEAESLATESYAELRGLSQEILQRFPPDQYHYLGVGRSPTGILAMLEALQPGSATELPISGFRTGVSGPLSESQKLALQRHIERIVPLNRVRGRKLLVIDYTVTGSSLEAVAEWLRDHRARKGDGDAPVETLGLSGIPGARPNRAGENRWTLDGRFPRLDQALASGEFKEVAPHREHRIQDIETGADPFALDAVQSEKSRAFRRALNEEIASDLSNSWDARRRARWLLRPTTHVPRAGAPLGPELFRDVRALASDITRRFPPQRYHYVMVGRSPTPLRAYLEATLPGQSCTLPLSQFKFPMGRRGPDDYADPLGPASLARVYQHLDRSLPPAERLAGKRLLLVDLAVSGTASKATHLHVESYLAARGRSPESVESLVLAMSPEASGPPHPLIPSTRWHEVPFSRVYPQLADAILKEVLEAYAEYGRFPPQAIEAGAVPARGDRFDELLREMRYRLSKEGQGEAPVDFVDPWAPTVTPGARCLLDAMRSMLR